MAKKGIHPQMHTTKVVDINGFEFEVVTTTSEVIKVETSHLSHPTYNPDKVIKKQIKGRMEKFLEKQKRMDAAKKAA